MENVLSGGHSDLCTEGQASVGCVSRRYLPYPFSEGISKLLSSSEVFSGGCGILPTFLEHSSVSTLRLDDLEINFSLSISSLD